MLATHELGDADLIVTLLTEQHGQIRGVARSARSSRKRFGGVLEPLTPVHAVWTERDGRDLHRIESMEGRGSFAGMQAEPAIQAVCAVFSEIAGSFVQEGQDDARSYRLLGAVLEALDGGGTPEILLRYFEYWMLRLHGLLPDLGSCANCAGDLIGGTARVGAHSGLLCGECSQSAGGSMRRFAPADRQFLAQASRCAPAEMPPSAAAAGGGALEYLLRGMLESFAERRFKTYRHFRAATEFGGGGSR